VTVSIGGVPAANVIVRSSAALPGASEIVAEVPAGVDSGDTVPLRISVAGQTSPPVTLVLQTADNPLQSPPGR
jgi:uncharacterized protein (TIGR03437 family)